jgi:hypothetical protein
MATDHGFLQKIEQIKTEVRDLEDSAERENIEQTASRLEGLNYTPPLVIPVSDFLRLTAESLLGEIDKILAKPDRKACTLAPDETGTCQDMRLQGISVLLYYYKQLIQLRRGDPDTWDEVDELYLHD